MWEYPTHTHTHKDPLHLYHRCTIQGGRGVVCAPRKGPTNLDHTDSSIQNCSGTNSLRSLITYALHDRHPRSLLASPSVQLPPSDLSLNPPWHDTYPSIVTAFPLHSQPYLPHETYTLTARPKGNLHSDLGNLHFGLSTLGKLTSRPRKLTLKTYNEKYVSSFFLIFVRRDCGTRLNSGFRRWVCKFQGNRSRAIFTRLETPTRP